MTVIRLIAVLLVVAGMSSLPLSASAEKGAKSEVVMKTGSTVSLFHSGTADVKKEICVNDVLPVYRELMAGGHTQVKEVGKVRVLSYVGSNYMEARIEDGDVKTGDVARKATASCLVQPKR